MLAAGGRRSAPEADRALEELCRTYWYPLYAYVRRRGHTKEDAEDLTQGFFARFLERNYLEGLRSEKDRFRAFLLAGLKHFLANEYDRAGRQKRGGGVAPLSLDWQDADARYQIDPADQLSPDKLYDRAWATTLLEQVIARLRKESALEGKGKVFEQLKPFLMSGQKRHSLCASCRQPGLERRRGAGGGPSPAQALPRTAARGNRTDAL